LGAPRSGPDGFSDTDLDFDDLTAGPHTIISPWDKDRDPPHPDDDKVPPPVSSRSSGVDSVKVTPVGPSTAVKVPRSGPDGLSDTDLDSEVALLSVPPTSAAEEGVKVTPVGPDSLPDQTRATAVHSQESNEALPPLLLDDGSDDDDLDDDDVVPPMTGDFDSDLEDLLCLHDNGTSVCW